MKHEYAFDICVYASLRVHAETREEAEAMIRENFNYVDAKFGCWPDGTPILAAASLGEDRPVCFGVDGSADHPEVD